MIAAHVHSDYSNYGMQDSVNKLPDIINRVKELGMKSWCLTDHNTCSGIPDAYKKSLKAGLKLIPGAELYYTDDLTIQRRDLTHITFWAKDIKGLQNLYKMTSEAHGNKGITPTNFFYKSRVDINLIRKYSKGLMCGTACLGGILKRENGEGVLRQLHDIFQDDLFIELHTYQCEDQYIHNRNLIKLAEKHKITMIVATDAHFSVKSDYDLHAYFKNTSKVQEGDEHLNETLYIQSEDEVRSNLRYLPSETVEQAIANTMLIDERSNVTIEFGGKHYPTYPCDSPLAEVRQKCIEGWNRLIKDTDVDKKLYGDRIKYELGVLERQDYCSYFLITNSYLEFARKHNIPIGRGRGSVVASMVAYLMGMTALDSIKYKLVFERFAHDQRIAPPDIDCDVSRKHRNEVIDYIRETYGEVYQCRTFQKIGAKGAVRRAGLALHWSQERINDLLKTVSKYEPEEDDDEQLSTSEQKLWILEHLRNDSNSDLIDLAKRFVGIISGYSKHASAVLILSQDITDFCSVERQTDSKTKKPCWVSSCAFTLLEEMGLMKADVLGLKTLDVIADTIELMGGTLDIENIPLNDPLTFQMLCEGKTKGVFQLGSPGMTQLVKDIAPNHFNDLIPLVALYRPGCLNAIVEETGDSMVKTYVLVRSGEIEPTYLHDKLRTILEPTYSIILYQEQILEIAKQLCGYSLGEADVLRRIIGKKKLDEMQPAIDAMIERGITNGIPKEVMEKITKQIVEFAAYCFNKAHSAAYGLIAYQTAYLKAHYPLEFMTATLNSEDNDHDKLMPYIKELKKLGIPLLPPDIRYKNADWVIDGEGIRMGLHYIKGIGNNLKLDDVSAFAAIIKANNKGVNTGLIKAGALDNFGLSRMAMLNSVLKIDSAIASTIASIAKNTQKAIDLTLENERRTDKLTKIFANNILMIANRKSDVVKLNEKLLKLYDDQKIMKSFDETIGEYEVLGYSEGITPDIKVGKLTNLYSKVITNGTTMAWLTLKSDYGEFRCACFSDIWDNIKNLVVIGCSYKFIAKSNDKGDTLEEISIDGVAFRKPPKETW